MITIAKRFTFDAAHCLPLLPDGHKCKRLHGHTYEVEIVCRGPIDKASGMLLDYADIAKAWQRFHDLLDHRYLNDIAGLELPTTENLVEWIFATWYRAALEGATNVEWRVWGSLDRIRLRESSTTWAEMTKDEWVRFYGRSAAQ